ncbi:MAG: pilus assembly protein [Rhodospirillaceae bacterium]|nr:pilus assembly protein [Rhodospirillaceae bacterium]
MKYYNFTRFRRAAATVASFGRCVRAVAAVEFALITPAILVSVTGIAGYGLVMYDKMSLTSAVQAGAQLALVDASSTTAIKNAVVSAAAASGLGLISSDVMTTEFCEDSTGTSVTCSSGNRYYMTVSVSTDVTLFLLNTSVTLNESATIRTQ